MEKTKFIESIPLILNLFISIQFIVLEQFTTDIDNSLIVDVICLLCAIFFSIIHLTKYLNWIQSMPQFPIYLVDISPFFFWVLILKRIITVQQGNNQLLYFILGFLNGQYASQQKIIDNKLYVPKIKIVLQQSTLFGSVLYKFNHIFEISSNSMSIIFPIILSFTLGVSELVQLIKTPIMIPQKDEELQSQKQQSSYQQPESTCKYINQRPPTAQLSLPVNPIWDEFIQNQIDDWICKIEFYKRDLTSAINSAIANNSLRKYLDENTLNLMQFFKNIKVIDSTYNLQQSLPLAPVEQQSGGNLVEWLTQNFMGELRRRRISQIDDPLNSPLGEVSRQFNQKDPFNDRIEISQILNQQEGGSIGGSLQIPEKKVMLLQCQIKYADDSIIEVVIQVFYFEFEQQGERSAVMTLVIRNIEKQVQQWQQHGQLMDKMTAAVGFIKRQAGLLTKITKDTNNKKSELEQQHNKFTSQIKKVTTNFQSLSFQDHDQFIKSEKLINQQRLSEQRQSEIKQDYLNIPNHKPTTSGGESNEDLKEMSEPIIIASSAMEQFYGDTLRFVLEIYTKLIIMENNNLNFYEVFSLSISKIKPEKIDIQQAIKTVIDMVNHHENKRKYQISIFQHIENNSNTEIVTDRRMLRQVLVNFLVNALNSFTKEDQLNQIQIQVRCKQDRITIQIEDNGNGIKQEHLSQKRLNDCKLGIAASQKILRQIGQGFKGNPEIYKKTDKGSQIIFYLQKYIADQQQQEDFKFESIQLRDQL